MNTKKHESKMTNDEIRMTKEFPMANSQKTLSWAEAVLTFELCHYFVIRISSFVIPLDMEFRNSSLTTRRFRFKL